MEKKWYAVRMFPGYELKVKEKLEAKIKADDMTQIDEVYIPFKKNYVFVRKHLKLKEELIFPGTIFVHMNMNNETMAYVRGIQYVTGYFGKNENKKYPDPVEDDEMARMKDLTKEIDCVLEVGSKVLINVENDGLNDFEEVIKAIDFEDEVIVVQTNDQVFRFEDIEKII